jgi:ubiquinone/menaquinone biosynthesis C-methylase UbiE
MNRDEYRRVAGFYDRLFEPMNRGLRLLGLRMFKARKSMKVLDIGCGTGTHLEIYKRSRCELYGIDTSPSMLEIARNRLGEDAHLSLDDATHMPFEDRTFDLVLTTLVLHEMDQSTRLATIAEMKRVLKTGGRILWIDFHAGKARFPKGWMPKMVILLSELAAGRRHFRNYRHFVSIGGLPALVETSELEIESQKVVGEGTMALLLLRA